MTKQTTTTKTTPAFLTVLNKFLGSELFIALNAMLVLLAWLFNIWVPIMCVIVSLAVFSLFISRDTKQVFPALFMFSMTISVNHKTLDNFAPMLCLIILLFVGMLFNLIYFKRSFASLRPAKIKGFACAFIALGIPFALGGIGTSYTHPMAIVAATALIVLMGVGYCFFTVTLSESSDKEKLPEYMLKILFSAGIVMSIQLIVFYLRLGSMENIIAAMIDKQIFLGWAGPNNVAPMLSMCIPAALYFCIKKNKFTLLFVAVALMEYILIFTTGCRGAILFSTIAMPPMMLYIGIKSENRGLFCATVCLVFAVAIFLIGYFGEDVAKVLTPVLNKGLGSSGRDTVLYPEAWAAFKSNPIFGVGWDYRLGELVNNNYTPYWFHSTALQIMAMMGVVGMIFFAFFYFWRYRTFFALIKNSAVLALLAGLAMFDAYGMIDTNFFGPTYFLMLLMMTIVAEVNLPENKCRAFGGRDPIKDIATLFGRRKDKPVDSPAEGSPISAPPTADSVADNDNVATSDSSNAKAADASDTASSDSSNA